MVKRGKPIPRTVRSTYYGLFVVKELNGLKGKGKFILPTNVEYVKVAYRPEIGHGSHFCCFSQTSPFSPLKRTISPKPEQKTNYAQPRKPEEHQSEEVITVHRPDSKIRNNTRFLRLPPLTNVTNILAR